MDEKEFLEIFGKLYQQERRELNDYIESCKKTCESHNKPYREMEIGDGTRYSPSIYPVSDLQALIDEREKLALYRIYAEATGKLNFADENKALQNAIESDEKSVQETFSQKEANISLAGLAGLVLFFFGTVWGILGGVVGLTCSIFIANRLSKKRIAEAKREIEWLSPVLEKRMQAVAYANEKIGELSQTERETFFKLRAAREKYFADHKRMTAEIEQLKADIAALGRELWRTRYSSTSSQNTTANVASNGEGRREIVDDLGRRQGYIEDGKVYNEQSNHVGYIDFNNRIYDTDHKRIGEVREDGRIEKYR